MGWRTRRYGPRSTSLCPCFNSTSRLHSAPSTLRDQMATKSPSTQMDTPTESERTVRRIATGPNGCTQAATNRTKPTHTGIRASLAARFCCSAADLMEQALMFQYTPSETQQTRMRIPAGIEAMLSPQQVARQFRNQASRGARAVGYLNTQGRPPLARGRRIKRRIISCAQLGSRTYERTRTNQEVYYQPTGAKTQRHARVASAHTSSVTRMQIMVLRW